jgi:Predicted membrane protein
MDESVGFLQSADRDMIFKDFWKLIKTVVFAWMDDYAPSMGAALAYYTTFSLAPLLIIVIAVAGLLFGQEAAQGAIVEELRGLLGQEGASAVQAMLESARRPASGIIATIVGVITLLIGATTVFGELQDDLDRIWKAEHRPGEGLWNLVTLCLG